TDSGPTPAHAYQDMPPRTRTCRCEGVPAAWQFLFSSFRNTWIERHWHLDPHSGWRAALRQASAGAPHTKSKPSSSRRSQPIYPVEAGRTRFALESLHTPPRWRPAGDNAMERRIFVSVRSNRGLDGRRRQLKAAIINKIRDAGYAPQEFFETGIAEN